MIASFEDPNRCLGPEVTKFQARLEMAAVIVKGENLVRVLLAPAAEEAPQKRKLQDRFTTM